MNMVGLAQESFKILSPFECSQAHAIAAGLLSKPKTSPALCDDT